MDDALIGRSLGRYQILDLLGEGGMGRVYEARDPELERSVALKVLPSRLADEPRSLERFKREARSAAALSHPNVVTLHSVEEAEGTHFLTRERVRGETLDRLIPEHGMAPGEIVDRALQLAEGLRAAHLHGIVHRDLKPANVVVDAEGRLRILDFGLAKPQPVGPQATQAETALALTTDGAVQGTVPYMSPEQLNGQAVDPRSDVFSLGVILYEMCTGRRPFTGVVGLIMMQILREDPAPVRELRQDLPEGLERIVGRCLEKDPAARYPTAGELCDQLRALEHRETGPIPATGTAAGTAAGRRAVRPAARPRRIALAAALGAAALLGLLLLRPFGKPPPAPPAAPAATAPVAAADSRKMIVVLPFENLGPPEDEYFAAGMTEEITSRLAVVSGLGVISRNSAVQYAQTTKTTRQIGTELGVDYLLEGTVRWAREPGGATRLRITPQLISVSDDTHLWADSYDRLMDDVFRIQSEIAARVVAELGVTLLEPERRALEQRPTENLEAYRLYLRGEHYLFGPERSRIESRQQAVELFQRAVELDPAFTAAWGGLMFIHARIYAYGYDTSATRRQQAEQAFNRVLELAPEDPYTRLVEGAYHFFVHRSYERAVAEYARAEQLRPNDPLITEQQAYPLRRLGRFEEAAAKLDKTLELDPRNAGVARNLAETYCYLRRYRKAEAAVDLALAINPDWISAYGTKARVLLLRDASTAGARAVLDAMPGSASRGHWLDYWLDLYDGHYGEALEGLAASSERWLGRPVYFRPKELLEAFTHSLRGEPALARSGYDSARAILQTELEENPDHAEMLSALGVAYAGLGRKDEAIRHARRATELMPLDKEPYFGLTHVEDLAWVYSLLGEIEPALGELELLLGRPSHLSWPLIELDPRWAPLREHPRYRELKAATVN